MRQANSNLNQTPLLTRCVSPACLAWSAWPVSLGRLCCAVLTASVIAACGGGGDETARSVLQAKRTPGDQLVLKAADSCTDWRSFAARSFVEQALSPVYAFLDATTPAAGENADEGSNFTDTNVQELGVDEADLVETDNARGLIYAVHRESNSVRIINAEPANQTQQIGQVGLLGDSPIGIFFEPETARLAVISTDQTGTRMDFYSVAAANTATLLSSYWVDGGYLGARRIASRIHLVTTHGFHGLDGLYQNDTFNRRVNDWFEAQGNSDAQRSDAIKAQLIAQATVFASGIDIRRLVPNRAAGLNAALVPLACESLFKPDVATAMATVLVSSINTDGSGDTAIAAANNAWMLYASADNVYLAQTSGGWFFAPFQVEQTAIYRFEISATGAPEYRGGGLVDGWLLNRFSMGEHAGHLRVATSRLDQCQSSDPNVACPVQSLRTNDVTVLRLDADAMRQVGNVTDFGLDERIFSARFIGDTGYVVTFRQIDPLFTFDLSDPSNPRLLGEVEIPGFSSYIQPIAEGRLLTIGRAAGAGGVGTGNAFQLQVFDVSDLRNPARIAAASPALEGDDYAYSVAEYDPRAFTYAANSATTGLLSVPSQIGSRSESRSLSGFTTWTIDTAGSITESFRVDHKQTVDGEGQRCPPASGGSGAPCAEFAPVVYNAPLRSVIATDTDGQTLYTLSDAFLIVTDAAQGTELARVVFDPPSD